MMSRIDRSSPPGVSSWMTMASVPLSAACRMLFTMYSPMGGVMTSLTVMTSTTRFSPAA